MYAVRVEQTPRPADDAHVCSLGVDDPFQRFMFTPKRFAAGVQPTTLTYTSA